jgi:Arc/MetJ family transcription regulator
MVFLSKLPLHAARYTHQKLNPLLFETLHINEFPKSGGTWVCRMLRDLTGWRFDDNAIPLPGKAVVKYHRLPLDVRPLAVVVRDPRDVFVSLFHHSKAVFEDDPFNTTMVKATREIFEGQVGEAAQLGAFVERQLTDPIYPGFAWNEFYEHFLARGTPIFRYEDFRADTGETLAQLLQALGVETSRELVKQVSESHSIDRILARRAKNGEDAGNTFVRRGKVGGYAEVLSPETIARIEESEGATMRKFGYL